VRGGPGLHPGSGNRPVQVFLENLGPFSLERAGSRWSVQTMRGTDAERRICGHDVDWVELVRPGASLPGPPPQGSG
jgi:hypothetical protein